MIVVMTGIAIVHIDAIPMDFTRDPVVYTYATNNGTEIILLVITTKQMNVIIEVNVLNDCFILKDPYTKRLKFLIELSLLGSR